jgi:hypothetical protein
MTLPDVTLGDRPTRESLTPLSYTPDLLPADGG